MKRLMYRATVRVRFSAGHRLPGHSGKCRRPHGHSYAAEVTLASSELTSRDWIDDFDAVKNAVKGVIGKHFDHAFIVDSRDNELIDALGAVDDQKIYVLDGRAPTAERIAEELFRLLSADLTELFAVRLWETADQYAEYSAEQQ